MQKRVLFVDDEPSIRSVYAMLPPFLGDDYEVVAVSTAREALARISRESFDVVVSDLMMPEMTGAELLARVAEGSPATARVVVSGFGDEITVAKCLLAAHRYFTKPFNPIALTTTIQSLVRAREASSNDSIRKLVGKLDALPTPSETYLGLMKALNARDKTLAEIALILERDPSLAAKVLQAVNSAMFGVGRRVVSLVEALQIMGLHVLRALVLTIQVFDFYQKPELKAELKKVWTHSVNVANQARRVCQARNWPEEICEEAFLSALLHDIGRIILAATPEPVRARFFPEYQFVTGESGCALSRAIEAEAGGYLLGLWGIPDGIVTAVRTYSSYAGLADTPSAAHALAIAHELEVSSVVPAVKAPDRHCNSILIMSNDAVLTQILVARCQLTNRFHMIAASPAEAFQTFHDLQFDLAVVDPLLFPYPVSQVEGHLRQINAITPIRVLLPEQPAAEQVSDIFQPAASVI